MAKKRRKEEEEEFQLPEFNETEFLRKEITSAKMILLVALLAIVAAVISYFLTLAGIVVVAFFAGLAVVLLLKYVPKMFGVDTKKLERKDWFGYGSTYFFAWLAIWVLVMNVPFSDVTPPGLVLFVDGAQVAPDAQVSVSSAGQSGKDWAVVTAKATDNAGISAVLITIGTASQVLMEPQSGNDVWSRNVTHVTVNTFVTVTAADINGHTSSVTIMLMP
jgi:hypothetical protein